MIGIASVGLAVLILVIVITIWQRQKTPKSNLQTEKPQKVTPTLNFDKLNELEMGLRMDGTAHSNKMECMKGEIRDRERVMRTLEKTDSPILVGYRLFHNYIRPHMALNGKTPAEEAGIVIKGQNKWLAIIQNAKRASSRIKR
jgi:hypothetical protein